MLNEMQEKYPRKIPANREWLDRLQREHHINKLGKYIAGKTNYIDIGRFRICTDTYETGTIFIIYEYLDFWYGCPERFYIIDENTYNNILSNKSNTEKVYEIIANR